MAAGATITFATAYALRKGIEAVSPGYAKTHTVREVQQSYLGGQPRAIPGLGHTHGSGKAAKGRIDAREAAMASSLIQHPGRLKPDTKLTAGEVELIAKAVERGMASHKTEVHLDGVKLAEGLSKNTQAARRLAESTAHTGLKYAARR
jgi:hypothetical protein